ncbi:hypothetical protein E4U42_006984 [Claviceps africana]|uniref:Myb-like domain-containing protein n=1 Tax=Claviceps africana TaxID=83212 RepID=A0A8K0J7J5_9HYPO|nr:hypothetical protein E4U42_006984 [Claviceps africana]
MLLPSALSCDATQPLRSVHQPTSYFSPPSSPLTLSSATALSNIMTTCRSLQSLIASPPPSAQLSSAAPSSRVQLLTPPMAYAPLPVKLRSRSRPSHSDFSVTNKDLYTRRKIARRCAAVRGVNKPCCSDNHNTGRENLLSWVEGNSETDVGAIYQQPQPSWLGSQDRSRLSTGPSTPKRARIAPEQLPLGLERSDFHNVHSDIEPVSDGSTWGKDVEVEADGNEWSAEDDRVLIELVLEKLKLSKSEWQDCARNLGKDRYSVNRRWKSLITRGEVGVKTRITRHRARLHSTWR